MSKTNSAKIKKTGSRFAFPVLLCSLLFPYIDSSRWQQGVENNTTLVKESAK
jgi:hypothetical protein